MEANCRFVVKWSVEKKNTVLLSLQAVGGGAFFASLCFSRISLREQREIRVSFRFMAEIETGSLRTIDDTQKNTLRHQTPQILLEIQDNVVKK